MSQNKLKAREKLEENYSSLIRILEEEKSNYEKEKEIYIKNIEIYNDKITEIKNKRNDILGSNDNFIDENKKNGLIPEKFHEIDILERKQDLYQEILVYLNQNKANISNEFDRHIKECQHMIDKFKNETEAIKQQIWKGEFLEIKINEVTDLKELKKYYKENEKILEKIND